MRYNTQQQKCESLQKKIDHLVEQKQTHQQHSTKLSMTVELLTAQVHTLTQERQKLVLERDSEGSQLQHLNHQLTGMREENESLKLRISELEAAHVGLDRLNICEKELKSLKHEYTTMKGEYMQLQSQYKAADKQHRHEVDDLRQQLANQQALQNAATTRIHRESRKHRDRANSSSVAAAAATHQHHTRSISSPKKLSVIEQPLMYIADEDGNGDMGAVTTQRSTSGDSHRHHHHHHRHATVTAVSLLSSQQSSQYTHQHAVVQHMRHTSLNISESNLQAELVEEELPNSSNDVDVVELIDTGVMSDDMATGGNSELQSPVPRPVPKQATMLHNITEENTHADLTAIEENNANASPPAPMSSTAITAQPTAHASYEHTNCATASDTAAASQQQRHSSKLTLPIPSSATAATALHSQIDSLVTELHSLKNQYDNKRRAQPSTSLHNTPSSSQRSNNDAAQEEKPRESKRRSSSKKSKSEVLVRGKTDSAGSLSSVGRVRNSSRNRGATGAVHKMHSSMMNELDLVNDRMKHGLESILKRIEKQQLS